MSSSSGGFWPGEAPADDDSGEENVELMQPEPEPELEPAPEPAPVPEPEAEPEPEAATERAAEPEPSGEETTEFGTEERRATHRLEPLQPRPRRRWIFFGPYERPEASAEGDREKER
jgi:hypothetical protein